MIICDKPHIIGPWVCSRTGGQWVDGMGSAIGLQKNGEIIAGVVYDNWNGAQIMMHVASDGSKRWLNREFLWFVFYYPFVQLGAKRITGLVAETNKEARKFDENLGFELETTLKDAHPDGDLLVYKMTPDKCRWLKRREYGREIIGTSKA